MLEMAQQLTFLGMENEEFREISHAQAGPFIEKWHYSKRVPTGKNIFFGWFPDGEMYAVANYGPGVNTYQAPYLEDATGWGVTQKNLVELKRLCRIDPVKIGYPLTRFLSLCHKSLRRRGVRFVVSFSDPAYGHNGGIYRAANFRHLGTTAPEYHVIDAQGEVRHRRYPFRYARRNGCSVGEARWRLGVERIMTPPKDRWLLKIGDKK